MNDQTVSSGASENPSSIPTDPSDKYFLTHCFVCQAVAKPEQEYIRNYGGVVCFSCRAFWRRAHLKTRNPELRCKSGGGCSMTIKSHRKCQKCRYDLCVKAGMTHSAILTEEQKKVRFRKALQKRQQEVVAPPSSTSRSQTDAELQYNDDLESLQDLEPIGIDELEVDDTQVENLPLEDFNPSLFSLFNAKTRKSEEIMSKKVEEIIQTYKYTMEQTGGRAYQDLTSLFRGFNEDTLRPQLSKRVVMSIVEKLLEDFHIFAMQQRHFVCLSENDRKQILARNSSLYVQLQFASCLLASDESVRLLQQGSNGSLTKRFLYKLQSLKSIFRADADLNYYSKLIRRLSVLWLLDQFDQRALLSYILLFDNDSNLNLSQPADMEDVSIMNSMLFTKHVEVLDNRFDLQMFSSIITKMSIFCSNNIDLTDDDYSFARTGILMPYTEAEEHWLTYQYQLFDEAFFSVHIGEEIIQEFFMYSLGVPLSKHYFHDYFNAQLERMKKIYKKNPEFEAFPVEIQDQIIQTNSKLGLALIVARSENFSSGYAQITSACSDRDNEWWKRNFAAVFDSGKTIQHLSVKDSRILTEKQLAEYFSIIHDARSILGNPELFKLKLLLALTMPEEGTATTALSSIHRAYQTILRRRLEWTQSTLTASAKIDPDEAIANIIRGIQRLRPLKTYLQIPIDFIEKGSQFHHQTEGCHEKQF